jgi:hypothetical protein
MPEPSDPPPLPLQMGRADVRRVSDFLADRDTVDNERLLIEILDCLRAIDDKLESVREQTALLREIRDLLADEG